jgi:hypothetical protein
MSQEPAPEVQGVPVTALNWQDPPANRWAFWHVGDLLPTYRVPRGDGAPRPLPAAAARPDLLSVPVTTGFLAGISVHIIVGQLPTILGLEAPHGPPRQSRRERDERDRGPSTPHRMRGIIRRAVHDHRRRRFPLLQRVVELRARIGDIPQTPLRIFLQSAPQKTPDGRGVWYGWSWFDDFAGTLPNVYEAYLVDGTSGLRIEELAPNLDYLCPMVYPSGYHVGIPGFRNPVQNPYEVVKESVRLIQHRASQHRVRVRPWLQDFKDYAFDRRIFGVTEVRAQIKGADDAGAVGWMLWNPRNDYTASALRQKEASGTK